MKFSDLGLSDEILRAVGEAGYEEPTPIQASAIPVVLMGRDVLGCAQTGTGKTASFTLPMIDILSSGRAKARMPRSLILEPTRELAAQVAENFDIYGKYTKLSKALLIGGSSMEEQIKVLNRGVDVLIATPGRLLDVFDRGHLLLNDTKILVVDEADRMLDMGFIPDVEKIVSLLSPMRTTLLFSATMPKEIRNLANKFLSNPKEISVAPPASTADTIKQGMIKVRVASKAPGAAQKVKRDTLRKLIEAQTDLTNALVFCNRKRDVDVVQRSLEKHGFNAARLHGDMVQSVRMDTLDKFKKNEVAILVCSDVAARGLDISSVSHVFNFDVPTHSEDYVHRIGRTGRAGRKGAAFTIALPEDKKYIDGIEKLIGKAIPTVEISASENAPDTVPLAQLQAEEKAKGEAAAKAEPKGQDKARDMSEKKAEAPEKDEAKAKPARKRSNGKSDKKEKADSGNDRKRATKSSKNDQQDGGDANGTWGQHMPAFLTKEVELPKASKKD